MPFVKQARSIPGLVFNGDRQMIKLVKNGVEIRKGTTEALQSPLWEAQRLGAKVLWLGSKGWEPVHIGPHVGN